MSETTVGNEHPLTGRPLKLAKVGSSVLVSDAASLIEIARRTPSAVQASVAHVAAQAANFDVFVCVWRDPQSALRHALEIVKAKGEPFAGGKGVRRSYRLSDVGAVLVRSRAFALDVARQIGQYP